MGAPATSPEKLLLRFCTRRSARMDPRFNLTPRLDPSTLPQPTPSQRAAAQTHANTGGDFAANWGRDTPASSPWSNSPFRNGKLVKLITKLTQCWPINFGDNELHEALQSLNAKEPGWLVEPECAPSHHPYWTLPIGEKALVVRKVAGQNLVHVWPLKLLSVYFALALKEKDRLGFDPKEPVMKPVMLQLQDVEQLDEDVSGMFSEAEQAAQIA